ncbi:unnamed protein product [Brassica rapa]|uniref:Uncharacterized protein n=2 Tax=Brassica TaxID=3705 RepID=A0A3P5YY21_BRACM|nr:unnamed protein product [Brassica napus]CAG7877675.1 unnamed protein product [Brassica rapa]VDC72687.1 unnamed protein product [Brassica rapa]
MLRIKRSVSAGYSQVFSLISYNQVQLTSNCFLVNSELISFCYRTRRKKDELLFILFPLFGILLELHL